LKLRQYEQGKFFCDAIVSARGPAGLNQLWTSPESLPTLQELRNPTEWLTRTMPTALEQHTRSRPDAAA
jgi:uncharacterized protein (DUF2342 family)